MKDLLPCSDIREDFQRWLGCGVGPLTITQRGQAAVTLNSLPKTEEIDYLYCAAAESGGVTWDNDLKFFGVYDHRDGSLYMTLDSLRTSAVKDMVAPVEADAMTMDEIINAAVNHRVEDIIANDRNNLPVAELTSTMALHDLKEYQLCGAKEKAVDLFFSGNEPDGQFHSGFAMKYPWEAAFIAYITDSEMFIQDEAEMYIKTHGEKLLLEFLKNDTLLAEYQTLMQNTDDPIHRVKGIRDAVIGWKAKTVCVTIRKDGQELTFRTGSTDLRSRFGSYGSSSIRAEDRQEFERLFGRRANYCAEDITKITYGRNTIYEAPPVQAEEMEPVMQMGGM